MRAARERRRSSPNLVRVRAMLLVRLRLLLGARARVPRRRDVSSAAAAPSAPAAASASALRSAARAPLLSVEPPRRCRRIRSRSHPPWHRARRAASAALRRAAPQGRASAPALRPRRTAAAMSSCVRCCLAARSVIAPGLRDRATGECMRQMLLAGATTEARGAAGVRLLAHRSSAAARV
eukprot:scaffold27212_cov59-Phaeocystis_antarctica.AAC.6